MTEYAGTVIPSSSILPFEPVAVSQNTTDLSKWKNVLWIIKGAQTTQKTEGNDPAEVYENVLLEGKESANLIRHNNTTRVSDEEYKNINAFGNFDPWTSSVNISQSYWIEGSTEGESIYYRSKQEVEILLRYISRFIDSENLGDSYFSNAFYNLIKNYSNLAVTSLSDLMKRSYYSEENLIAIIELLGNINHPETSYSRLMILKNYLESGSEIIRDTVGLALASLDNPIAIPWIEEAILEESHPILRKNLELVLDQLVETKHALLSA